MKNRCDRYRMDLVDLVDGTLDKMSESYLLDHLAACPSCSGLLSEMKEAMAAIEPVASLRRSAVPSPELASRIISRIRKEPVHRGFSFFAIGSSPVPLRRYAPIAAGFAVLLAIGVMTSMIGTGSLSEIFSARALGRAIVSPSKGLDNKGLVHVTDAATDTKSTADFSAGADLTPTLFATSPAVRNEAALVGDASAMGRYEALASSGVLSDASLFRGYVFEDGSIRLLVLFPSDSIQDHADRIVKELTSCASPFRIEIIDAKDIGKRLGLLGIAESEQFAKRAVGEDLRLIALDIGR